METNPGPSPDPASLAVRLTNRAQTVETSGPRVTGFLRLEVDKQKKATGSFLLFSNGNVLTGKVEGAASEGMVGHVEASFRLPATTARKLGTGQTVPVVVRCLRFDASDH